MIETKVPKDVRAYKTKIIGPFTLRQIVCFVAAALFDGIIYLLSVAFGIELNMQIVIYGLIFINMPILMFVLEPQGMPMEQFLSKVVFMNFVKPNKRKAEKLLFEEQKKPALTKKQKKEREKTINQIGHKNPSLRAYK